jgi:hypothetical protein
MAASIQANTLIGLYPYPIKLNRWSLVSELLSTAHEYPRHRLLKSTVFKVELSLALTAQGLTEFNFELRYRGF